MTNKNHPVNNSDVIRPKNERPDFLMALQRWVEGYVIVEKRLKNFVHENRENIKLWIQFAQVHSKFEPYLENIYFDLNDPDFKVVAEDVMNLARDVVDLAFVFDCIDLEKDPESISLLSLIAAPKFQSSLLNFYGCLNLDKDRIPLITEAFSLHNSRYFAGSVCLLYSILEGVVTESLCSKNVISRRANGGYEGVLSESKKGKSAPLPGLAKKIDCVPAESSGEVGKFYEKFKACQLVSGDLESTILKRRNAVLHGSSVDFNVEKHSAQLILWLYSFVLHERNLCNRPDNGSSQRKNS